VSEKLQLTVSYVTICVCWDMTRWKKKKTYISI